MTFSLGQQGQQLSVQPQNQRQLQLQLLQVRLHVTRFLRMIVRRMIFSLDLQTTTWSLSTITMNMRTPVITKTAKITKTSFRSMEKTQMTLLSRVTLKILIQKTRADFNRYSSNQTVSLFSQGGPSKFAPQLLTPGPTCLNNLDCRLFGDCSQVIELDFKEHLDYFMITILG